MDTDSIIYEKSYNDTFKNLDFRSSQKNFSIYDIQRELHSLYNYEDLDWTGRGEIKNQEIQGAIAAYQVFLNYWQKENLSIS